jgi:DnaJ-domain-containing protein 1
MGGCLIVFLLIGPVGVWLLQNPIVLVILILIVTFPILGAILLGKLQDYQVVSERYLFGLAEYLKDPEHHTRRSYKYYKQAFQNQKAEQARREWERRAREQRMWEERFRSYGGGFGAGYGQRTGPYGYSAGSSAGNPYVDFKSKYEKSCATLGIPVTTEESRIKLAYRKKAKQYHPDVNQAADATAKFQEISEAYEFLNEDNIRRYKGMMGSGS